MIMTMFLATALSATLRTARRLNPSSTLYFSRLAVSPNHRALEARDDRPT